MQLPTTYFHLRSYSSPKSINLVWMLTHSESAQNSLQHVCVIYCTVEERQGFTSRRVGSPGPVNHARNCQSCYNGISGNAKYKNEEGCFLFFFFYLVVVFFCLLCLFACFIFPFECSSFCFLLLHNQNFKSLKAASSKNKPMSFISILCICRRVVEVMGLNDSSPEFLFH